MKTLDAEWRDRFERFGRTSAEEHEVSGWSLEGLARRVRLFEQTLGKLPIPARATVLDVGCGVGSYVRYLAGRGHRVVGADYSLPSLARALAAEGDPNRRYVAADGYELPFRRRSFDLVVCIGVLQAVSCPERLLDEIARVLGPQGVLLMEVLNGFEIPALARGLLERVGVWRPRVRCDSPFQVRRWLERRRIRVLRRVGVYLPPRRLPWLGRILDPPAVTQALEGIPGGPLLGAHAFWMVGQRSP